VLLPGLWNPGVALALLSWRLERLGLNTRIFAYPTVRRDLYQNAAALNHFLSRLPDGRIHLVGYSLGGLVIRAFCARFDSARVGRVVMLGTPNQGSVVADRFYRWRLLRPLLGRGVRMLLAGETTSWVWPDIELGLIAGAGGSRLRYWPGPDAPNDGLVMVDEVTLAGARARLVLPVSHGGMLLSGAVADAAAQFVQTGHFHSATVGFVGPG